MELINTDIELGSYKGYLDFSKQKPTKSCKECVLELSIEMGYKLENIVKNCEKSLKSRAKQNVLSEDELFSLAIYTWSDGKISFCFILNSVLRERDDVLIQKWSGYLYYLQNAHSKLPNISGVVYRGISISIDPSEYTLGKKIHWLAYTSTTADVEVSKLFTQKDGIIFKIRIMNGKDISHYSQFHREREILLSLNMCFIVSKPLFNSKHGFKMIELIEDSMPYDKTLRLYDLNNKQSETKQQIQDINSKHNMQIELSSIDFTSKMVYKKASDLGARIQRDGWCKLGKGGFGEVYLAEWNYSIVAYKMLSNSELTNEETQQFEKELNIFSTLRHTNIVQYYGGNTTKSQSFCILELMETDLFKLIEEKDERVKWNVNGITYAQNILAGLAYLHNNKVVHRDLKSPNILISGKVAKICDFGFAKILESQTTYNSAFAPSIPWSSPEQFDKNKTITFATDIYSVGIIFWEMLTLSKPWSKVNLSIPIMMNEILNGKTRESHPIPQSCPTKLKELILKCWKIAPKERPTLKEIMIGLE